MPKLVSLCFVNNLYSMVVPLRWAPIMNIGLSIFIWIIIQRRLLISIGLQISVDTDTEKVKKHWEKEKTAVEFDNIYDNKGSLFIKLVNKFLRKDMCERAPLTIKQCGDLHNKTVLDVGCGTGRISFLLAKEATKVTGLDYSKTMIDLAKKYQIQHKQDNVEFICCDFLHEFTDTQKYDISIAIGVLDYIKEPIGFLKKMKNATNNKMIVSFNSKFGYIAPLRKIWLKSKNCPVFSYTSKSIKKTYSEIGIENMKIITLPMNSRFPTSYLVVAELRSTS